MKFAGYFDYGIGRFDIIVTFNRLIRGAGYLQFIFQNGEYLLATVFSVALIGNSIDHFIDCTYAIWFTVYEFWIRCGNGVFQVTGHLY